MAIELELEIGLVPISPDTPQSVGDFMVKELRKAIAESGLSEVLAAEPEQTPPQYLPPLTKEQVELVTIAISFAFKEGPNIIRQVRAMMDYLVARLSMKSRESRISGKWTIGRKIVEFKNLGLGDELRIVTDGYEVIMRPQRDA